MSEESKFILCPSCGAILEKGIIYCSYCGANVNEKPKEGFGQKPPQQPFQEQPPKQQVPPQQPHGNYTNRGFGGFGNFGKQESYADQENIYSMDQAELIKRAGTERKIMLANLFSWITFCSSILSPIFFIITMVYVIQARKAAGFMDPRITRAIIYAIVGLVVNIAINIPFFLSFFSQYYG
ncbi:MAG: zinc ribbon domain-containing protein [Candidatus Heimdallarchaeota archaeon]|nr:zinc ribbon domain-containing protein [Candidatus Heimdallarchaeota archaeon]